MPGGATAGSFWFFGANNPEIFVKVLDACRPPLNGRYWVFAAGLTDVATRQMVVDTASGATRRYDRPLGVSYEAVRYPPVGQDVREWTDGLIEKHRGQSVLIVGHSGPPTASYSLAAIVQALTRQPVAEIPESEYDNLFVVTIRLERRRYGQPE